MCSNICARVHGADDGADLRGADLSGASLRGTEFDAVYLRGTRMPEVAALTEAASAHASSMRGLLGRVARSFMRRRGRRSMRFVTG